ncbi:MAG TPA: glycosyltransferase family 4 protein, partial [Gammaproteobacteria bacterium]|nr:glycosyltransferase family 4 protein [Gammaproteobacteria bacterium]
MSKRLEDQQANHVQVRCVPESGLRALKMQALLYFEKLDLYSGAGQLLRMQAAGLEARGVRAVVAAQRGTLRFFLRTGIKVRRAAPAQVRAARSATTLVVDHGLAIPDADVVFVHNLAGEANRFMPEPDLAAAAAEEQFFRSLSPATHVAANSALVASALAERFGVARERMTIHHPGYQGARFDPAMRDKLRAAARRGLRIADSTPLVGLVTSGNFAKRGLDLFVAMAEHVGGSLPSARFLVVGARKLPDAIARHALVTSGKLMYRPKNHSPERFIAALDVFVYPARFEEFGMVVLEAAALGVPVLT